MKDPKDPWGLKEIDSMLIDVGRQGVVVKSGKFTKSFFIGESGMEAQAHMYGKTSQYEKKNEEHTLDFYTNKKNPVTMTLNYMTPTQGNDRDGLPIDNTYVELGFNHMYSKEVKGKLKGYVSGKLVRLLDTVLPADSECESGSGAREACVYKFELPSKKLEIRV